MQIHSVGVLGCGLMGSGIAQVCAQAGYKTVVREVDDTVLKNGITRIKKYLMGDVKKGRLKSESFESTMSNLFGTTHLDALNHCDVVIEAITERLEDKQKLFREVEPVVREDAILLSNTSSLCITELSTALKLPDRFAGLHFFSPVPVMTLVEVIRGSSTSEATYQSASNFSRAIGKDPIPAPDRPGFIVNRLLIPYLLNAVRSYEDGVGTIEDIDKSMVLGCGHPMGPFRLLDFIGLDTIYYIANIMSKELGDPVCTPPPLLERMVREGHFGRKTKKGFFTY